MKKIKNLPEGSFLKLFFAFGRRGNVFFVTASAFAAQKLIGTDREKRFMSEENFTLAVTKLRKVTSYIYFHILGEPTLHPDLPRFLEICNELDFKVIRRIFSYMKKSHRILMAIVVLCILMSSVASVFSSLHISRIFSLAAIPITAHC